MSSNLKMPCLHAGYYANWRCKEVQEEITRLLAEYLSWTVKIRKYSIKKKIKLRDEIEMRMVYGKGTNPLQWYEQHRRDEEIIYFKTLWYNRKQNVAILQGTINGKSVFVSISTAFMFINPVAVQKHIDNGTYDKASIDVSFTVKAYAYIERRRYYGVGRYDVLGSKYLS